MHTWNTSLHRQGLMIIPLDIFRPVSELWGQISWSTPGNFFYIIDIFVSRRGFHVFLYIKWDGTRVQKLSRCDPLYPSIRPAFLEDVNNLMDHINHRAAVGSFSCFFTWAPGRTPPLLFFYSRFHSFSWSILPTVCFARRANLHRTTNVPDAFKTIFHVFFT